MNPKTKPKMTLRNTALIRVARRIAAIHAEISYAQHRVDAIRTNPDLYLTDGDKMPETYAEFLFRTSGVLVREPIAARGQLVARSTRLGRQSPDVGGEVRRQHTSADARLDRELAALLEESPGPTSSHDQAARVVQDIT